MRILREKNQTVAEMLAEAKELDMVMLEKSLRTKSHVKRVELRQTRAGIETLTALYESLLWF